MITILTNKKEVATKYPTVGKAFQLIDDDSGCSFGENDYRLTKLVDSYDMNQIDGTLSCLSEVDLDTLCTGEVEAQLRIVKLMGMELAHEFLNCYFNLP